jgi:hypothetical protein
MDFFECGGERAKVVEVVSVQTALEGQKNADGKGEHPA